MSFNTPYFDSLRKAIEQLGGMYNAHLHLDRAGTMPLGSDPADSIHGTLSFKHNQIPRIHAGPHYDPEVLTRRVNTYLDAIVQSGATRAATVVDVTTDRVGLNALEIFLKLKQERSPELRLEVGAYSPLGFRDDEPERWALLEQGAERADFIGSLPERDDEHDYPAHIGFRENCRRMLDLADRLGKSLHVHVDQRNEPAESGSEMLMEVLDESAIKPSPDSEPRIWLIHFISPSTYDDARFQKLLAKMKHHGVGVICCPSAAISMRQLRCIKTPAFNSIARVLDLLAAGIQVRVGSDNICDLASPAGTPDLFAEMFVLCNALRFYDVGILAKLAAGHPLSAEEIQMVSQHQDRDRQEIQRIITHYGSPSPG